MTTNIYARKVEEEALFNQQTADEASLSFNRGWTILTLLGGLLAIAIAFIYYRLRRARIHSAVFQEKIHHEIH